MHKFVFSGLICLFAVADTLLSATNPKAQGWSPDSLHPDDNAAVSEELLSRRWPNGVVYYDIEIPAGSTRTEADFDSILQWEDLTSGAVRFVKSSTEEPRIVIALGEGNGTGGLRGIKESDGTPISAIRRIRIRPDNTYSVHHELGHVLGRWHQQRHPDSGECLTLDATAPARVHPDLVIGRYTSNSIMHYHHPQPQADYDTFNPDTTLCPRPLLDVPPSDFDIKYFQKMYGVNGDYFNNTSWCSGANNQLYFGDFNGDGLDDLLCHEKDGAQVPGRRRIDYANNVVDAVFEDGDWTSPSGAFCRLFSREIHIGDFDGDGRDDLLCFDKRNGRRFIDFANSSGALNGANLEPQPFCTATLSGQSIVGDIQVADFDADGRDDMLCHFRHDGTLLIDYSGNELGVFDWALNSGWCRAPSRSIIIGNFNSDGRADMLCHDINTGHRWLDYADAAGGFQSPDWNSQSGFKRGSGTFCKGANRTVHAADLSGNGLDDLICHNSRTGSVAIDYALTVEEARNPNDPPITTEGRGSEFWFANYFNEISFCNSQDGHLLIGRLPTAAPPTMDSLYCHNSATGHQVGRYSFDD